MSLTASGFYSSWATYCFASDKSCLANLDTQRKTNFSKAFYNRFYLEKWNFSVKELILSVSCQKTFCKGSVIVILRLKP